MRACNLVFICPLARTEVAQKTFHVVDPFLVSPGEFSELVVEEREETSHVCKSLTLHHWKAERDKYFSSLSIHKEIGFIYKVISIIPLRRDIYRERNPCPTPSPSSMLDASIQSAATDQTPHASATLRFPQEFLFHHMRRHNPSVCCLIWKFGQSCIRLSAILFGLWQREKTHCAREQHRLAKHVEQGTHLGTRDERVRDKHAQSRNGCVCMLRQ